MLTEKSCERRNPSAWMKATGVVFLLASVLAVSAYAFGLPGREGDDSARVKPVIVAVTQDHEGPAVVLGHDEPVAALPQTDMVRGRGVDQAAAALQPAIDLVPFDVSVPSYMPNDLQMNMLAAHKNSGNGWMQVFYGLPANGEYQQEVSILWEPFDPKDAEPAQPFSEDGEFKVEGRVWRYFVVNWPFYDTVEARTLTDDGMKITAWIRVIDMDQATALAELQQIIASM